MTRRLHERTGLLGQVPERLRFALKDGEQRYEWNHLGRRRIFRNLANFPLALADRKILYPGTPLFPWEKNPGHGAAPKGAKIGERDLFTGLIVKNLGDAAVKFGLSSFVKTVINGYNQDQEYRMMTGIADELVALSFTARMLDPEAAHVSRSTRDIIASPLYQLSSHADEANVLMSRLARGDLNLTDANIQGLSTHLAAISELCEHKAGIPAKAAATKQGAIALSEHSMQELSASPERHIGDIYAAHGLPQPSESIKRVLHSSSITKLADAQTLFAFASALISDGAFSLSSEIYAAQNDVILTGKESKKLAQHMAHALGELQLGLNGIGAPLNETLPHNVMLNASGELHAENVLKAANALLGHIRTDLRTKTDRMLAYADLHYADVDRLIASDTLSFENTAAERTALEEKVRKLSAVPSHLDESVARWSSRISVASSGIPAPKSEAGDMPFITRPQSLHEMNKLYGRTLPTYILQMPLNIMGKVILGHVKAPGEMNVPTWLPGQFGSLYKKMATATPSGRNLASNLFQTATFPISESYAGVGIYETMQLPDKAVIEQATLADDYLGAAMIALYESDEPTAGRIRELAQNNALQSLAGEYQEVLSKPSALRTQEDYGQLATYFARLGEISNTLFTDTYRLFTGDESTDIEGFKTHTVNVLTKGAQTGTDALMVFSFLRLMFDITEQQLLSLEYVNPEEALFDRKKLGTLSSKLLSRLQEAGYGFEGAAMTRADGQVIRAQSNAPGVKPGQMLRYDALQQVFVPLPASEMIDFANVIVKEMGQVLPVSAILTATHGRLSDTCMRGMEEQLLAPFQVAKPADSGSLSMHNSTISISPRGEPTLSLLPEKTPDPVPSSRGMKGLKQHFLRPELLHEMHKLRDRLFYVQLFSLPVQMVDNFLLGDSRNPKTGKSEIFAKKNIENVLFRTVTFPIVLSYGALWMREVLSFPGARSIKDAQSARSVLTHTVAAAARADTALPERIAALTGVNTALASGASTQSILDHAAAAFSQPHTGATSFTDLLVEIQDRSATTLDEAVLKLGIVETVLAESQGHINVLRYLPPEQQLLDANEVKMLSRTIEKSSRKLETLPSPESIIRFANTVGDRLNEMMEFKPFAPRIAHDRLMSEKIGLSVTRDL